MKKIITAVIAGAMLLSASAEAAGNIIFSGVCTDKNAGQWISVMTLKTNSDIQNPDFTDFGWIGQTRIGDDGRYNISVPLSAFKDGYEVKSNIILHKPVYVSATAGSAEGDGSIDSPVNTISAALALAEDNGIVVLLDTVTVPKNAQLKSDCKNITITGKNPETGEITGGIDMTGTVSMHIKFPAVLENLKFTTIEAETISQNANKIFACGNKVIFGEGLTMSNPIDIFGGISINNTVESTDITIKSGNYRRIFGGGENSPVTGDTHITVYGMNEDFSANDDSADYYDSRILGGGKNSGADVSGSTNINFCGGTVAYIVGGGSASAVRGDTNINISGGRVMNVYGGTVDKTTMHKANSNIAISGGMAESVFGGSMSCMFEGNTRIKVSGGEILRRIYGGCYNDFDGSWGSNICYVKGTTGITIEPQAKLVTGGDLSWENKLNSGIFAGSRTPDNLEDEESVIVFNKGAYDVHGEKTKEIGGSFTSDLLSHHDFIVKSDVGGSTEIVNGRNVKIIPDSGKAAMINGIEFFGGEYVVSESFAAITFKNSITISQTDAVLNSDGVQTQTLVSVGNTDELSGNERIIAAAYSENGELLGINKAEITGSGDYELNIDFEENSGSIKVRMYIWYIDTLKPIGAGCVLKL